MSDLPRMVSHHNYDVSSLPNSTGAPLNPKSLTSSDRSIIMGSSPTPLHHHQQARKVQVVYYLSRSGHLEHPHLLEISLPPKVEGLYLRDVKKKLAMIRGKRLPSAFAWSYKRSYKNGYVWQDLGDDDLIHPAHGCEYVLKGSEIIAEAAHQNAVGDNAVDQEEEAVQEQKLRARAVNHDSGGAGLQGHLARPSSKSYSNGNSTTTNAKVIDGSNHAAVINGFQSTETETSDEEVGNHVWKPLPSSNSSSSNSSCNNNNNKEPIDGGLTTSTAPPATTAPVYYRHHRVQKTAMILVESGTDAATQTDEEVQNHAAPTTSTSEGSTSTSSSQAGVVDSDYGTKPAPEAKTSNPLSGMLNSTGAAADVKAAAHHDQQAVQERAISASSKNAGIVTAASPPSPLSSSRSTEAAAAAAMCSNADASMSPLRKPSCGRLSLYPAANNNNYNISNTSSESEPSSARPPRSCKALSLLHLVSCGGLDVKEQILPAMPLTYHLKSASSSAPFKPSSSPNRSSSHIKPEQQLCTAEALGYGAPQAPKTSSSWKGSGASANMTTASKAKSSSISSHHIESYPEYNFTKGGISNYVSSPISSLSSGLRSSLFNQSRDHATTCSTPRSLTGSEAAVLPDVISLSRSSISDRSTNVSRELDYQTPRKNDKSGSSPSTLRQQPIGGRDQRADGGGRNIPEYSPRAGNVRRAVSGEIFRGSPLFVPSSSPSLLSSTVAGASASSLFYSQHQGLHNRAASMSFRQPPAAVPARPPAASERPVMRADTVQAGDNINHHNHNPPHKIKIFNGNSKLNDSNGPIVVQQLWQDLSASAASAAADGSSPSIIKPDSRRAVALEGTWDQQWERTLQNAIDLSLPPMELLVLHECPKCNRKLKPELMKAHTKTCNSSPPYKNNATSNFCINSNMMMMSKASSPRPQKVVEGSLYQRFLKASPPPKL